MKRICCQLQPKKVIFADEISTGLDSSTTYEIVKWMADTTHALNNTTLIALLQPAPETFDLFDDVILLRCTPQPCSMYLLICSGADGLLPTAGPPAMCTLLLPKCIALVLCFLQSSVLVGGRADVQRCLRAVRGTWSTMAQSQRWHSTLPTWASTALSGKASPISCRRLPPRRTRR